MTMRFAIAALLLTLATPAIAQKAAPKKEHPAAAKPEAVPAEPSGDLAYETVIETFVCKVAGKDAPVTWRNRVTHILHRAGGEWRLVHRHANRLEEQYRPGGRLG